MCVCVCVCVCVYMYVHIYSVNPVLFFYVQKSCDCTGCARGGASLRA